VVSSNTPKNFIRVGFANYTSHFIGALISILLARWLGPTAFGIFSIGFYVLTIFGMGFSGFDQSYVYFAVRFPKKEQDIFMTFCTLKIGIAFSIILLYSLLLLTPFPWNPSGAGEKIILYGLIGGLGMQFLLIALSAFQAREQFHIYSRIKLLYYVFLFFLILMGIQFNIEDLHYYLLMYIIPGILIMIIFKNLWIFTSRFRPEIAGKLWRFGKWLIITHFIRMINLRMDFFWLTRYYSGDILGQYSASLKLVNIFVILIGTFSVLLLPQASSMKSTRDFKIYWKENRKIIIFLLISWGVVFSLSPFLIIIMYGPQYLQAIPILRILLYSVIPLIFALPIKYIFLGMGKTAYLLFVTVIQALSLIVIIPFLANKMGVIGIAYGKVLSFFITLIFYLLVYKFSKPYLLTQLHAG